MAQRRRNADGGHNRRLTKATAAAPKATAPTKIVKMFTLDDDTWCAAKLLMPEPERFTEIFSRTLSAIRAGLLAFEKALA